MDGVIIDKTIPEVYLYCSKEQGKINKLLNISIIISIVSKIW